MAKEANKKTKDDFNTRAFFSVFAGFSLILLVLTGLALFSAPSCRVARDTGWTAWGHSKEQVVAVHVWSAVLFVIAAVYHIYLNWTVITKYFKAKTSEGIGFRAEWVAALLICLVVYVGTARSAWPFSSLIEWRESSKHDETGQGHGRRGGRGQAPAEETGRSDSADPEFHERGFQRQALNATQRGMGRMTLAEFCRAEDIDLNRAIARLKDKGFAPQDTMTMREIAANAGIHPRELRDILQPE